MYTYILSPSGKFGTGSVRFLLLVTHIFLSAESHVVSNTQSVFTVYLKYTNTNNVKLETLCCGQYKQSRQAAHSPLYSNIFYNSVKETIDTLKMSVATRRDTICHRLDEDFHTMTYLGWYLIELCDECMFDPVHQNL